MLKLSREGQFVDLNGAAEGNGRRISLHEGRNVEVLEVALGQGRVHRFVATYEPDVMNAAPEQARGTATFSGDSVLENNTGQSFTMTPGKGSVLIVNGFASVPENSQESFQQDPLATTLRRAGIEVSVKDAAEIPKDVLGLQAFDLIMLRNVSADEVDPSTQTQLAACVRDLGTGLVMIGGNHSFGAGGWQGTPLEPLLPVHLDPPDRIVATEVATLFVVDNSGSMRKQVMGSPKNQQELANEATALAIASLDKNDLVGVVVFNGSATVAVPLSRNTSPIESMKAVRDIRSGGGTDIAEALEVAIEQFKDVQAKVRHVVLLSDGKSQREEELPALADKLRQMNVKVSTIAVGDDADLTMMAMIAERGKGTYYQVANATTLPRIF